MDAFGLLDEWGDADPAIGVLVPTSDGGDLGHELATYGDPHRPYPLASVTKLLTALAVLIASEEGIVALDEPVGPPGTTVRHLLAHAGGLAPDQPRLLTEPGTRRIYSNAGFELLADAVSIRADMPFERYFHEAVVEPLQLSQTALAGSAAHGAMSSVADLAVVARELVAPAPSLIARETRVRATSAVFPELPGVLPGFGQQQPNPWGLGFEIRGRKQPHWTGSANAPSTFGHFGRAGTFLWVDPVADVVCIALTTREFGAWSAEVWPRFSDAVLGSTPR